MSRAMNPHLMVVSTILSLLPWNLEESQVKRVTKVNMFYAGFEISILLFLWSWNAGFHLLYICHTFDEFIARADIFHHTCMLIFCVGTIAKAMFLDGKYWQSLIQALKSKQINGTYYSKYISVQFFALNAFFVCGTIPMFFINNQFSGPNVYITDLYILVNVFIVLTTTLNVNNFAYLLHEQLIYLKNLLKEECTNIRKLKSLETNPYMISQMCLNFGNSNRYIERFVNFCKGTEAFNNIYGLQILGIAGIILMFTTDNVQYFILQLTERKSMGQDYDSVVSDSLLNFLGSCNLVIFGFVMVAPCYGAANEIDKIVTQCCKLLIELPHGLEDAPSKYLQEKVILLVKQLEYHRPYFTAAGLFEVNYSMLMNIFSAVISLVVVYIQLMN